MSDGEGEDELYINSGFMDNLVMRRTPGVDTEMLAERILSFADLLAGNRLYPYQRSFAKRIIEAVLERESEEITALFSRQSGKSHVIAAVVGALMILMPTLSLELPEDDRFRYKDPKSGTIRSYENGFWVGIFAPKKEQAGIIFSRVKAFFRSPNVVNILFELGIQFEANNSDRCRLSNGSSIKCSTASDQANIEGDTLHLGILEESQDISDLKANKSIAPMLASTGGCLVKIGTANAKKSHFLLSIRRNERRALEGGVQNHFFADWTVAAKYNSFYAKFVEKERRKLGERSDEFQMSYACRFILERGMAISERIFRSRTVIEGPFSDILPGPRRGMHYVAGVDFGKMHDSTVVTVLEVNWENPRQVLESYSEELGAFTVEIYGKHICDWFEMQGDDYEFQYHEIKKFLAKWGIERLALDYTGVGVAISDRIHAHFEGMDVLFVPFSSQMKDQLCRQLLADVHTGVITWPGGEECEHRTEYKQFRVQMVDLEKDYKNGMLDLRAPDIRGAHDDYPMSLALAIHAAIVKPFGGEVEETPASHLKSHSR